MTIKQRITEARGLCDDVKSDLEQLETLRGSGNAQTSCAYAENAYNLLSELTEHLYGLLTHYEREQAKRKAR